MHALVAAHDRIGRAGLDAQGAANAPALVNHDHAAGAFDAKSRVERAHRLAGQRRQTSDPLGAAGRTLVNARLAVGDGLGVGRAVGITAARALRLRQGGVNLARDGDFASNTVFINGLRRFSTASAWTPYVGAGIGWVQEIDIDITPTGSGSERGYSDGNEFAFQLIAGVEYTLTSKWSLTADTRYMRVGSVDLDNETGNADGKAGPLKYNPFSVQIGIRYSF